MKEEISNGMKKGFSLLETIIAIAVLLLLAVIITTAFLGLRDAQILNSAVERVVVLLEDARSETLASKNSSQYGVHFETNRVVFFKGDIFAEPNPDNKEMIIHDLIEISSISLNNNSVDVIFERLTGQTSQYGIVTISLKADSSGAKDITIEPSGIIGVQF